MSGDTSLLYTIFALDKASMINDKVGSSVNKLALGIGIAGAAIAAKSIQMAANFQSSMTRIQTSAGESAANIKGDAAGILNIAGMVGDTAQDLAHADYIINSGGQHGANSLLVLKAAAQGAKAEGADLNVVADATTSILQDYNLKATDSALITSELVTTTGQGKTSFEQLAGSLHSVLPAASVAHIALSDILGAEAAMTVHGMSADQATQNLADTIHHLTGPTLAQTKYMAQLGISASSVNDMLAKKGLTGTIQYLSTTILSKMGPSGKVLLGTFNQSAQAAENVKTMVASMPAPMKDLANQFISGKISAQDWGQALLGLTPTQANQMRQFATLEKRSTGFSDALKSGTPAAVSYSAALRGVMGDATGVNTALMLSGENTTYTNNAVAAIAKTTTEAGGNVQGWSVIQSTFNQRMAEFKANVGATGIRLGTVLLPAATAVLKVVMESVAWFTKHKTVTEALGITVGVLAASVLVYKTVMIGATVATNAAKVAMALWRGGLILSRGAVYAFNVAAYVTRSVMWEWVAAQSASLIGWISNAASVIANTVALAAYTVATTAVKFATAAWTVVQWALNAAFIASPIGWIVLGIGALVVAIVLIATKTTWFQTIWTAAWGGVWGFLKMVGAWFAGPFAGFFVDGYHKVMDGITTVKDWIANKIANIILTVQGVKAKIVRVASGMWDGIKNEFRGMINWIIDGWNRLHFTIPAVHFLGMSSPSFTLGMPHIQELAAGGTAYRGGLVTVGDRGPETMVLPAGAGIIPDGGRSARNAGSAGAGGVQHIHVHVHTDLPATVTQLGKHIRGNFSGDVQAALGGHAA